MKSAARYVIAAIAFIAIGAFLRQEYDRLWSRRYTVLTSTSLNDADLSKIELRYPSSSVRVSGNEGALKIDIYNGSDYYLTDIVVNVAMNDSDGNQLFQRPYRLPRTTVESLSFTTMSLKVAAQGSSGQFQVELLSAQGNPHRPFY
ncbi:hypothetical protein OAF27_03230 [Verrucomicrobiales bacterium]|nr:hypothetical protein [Verrucomicrobiales bacterium]